MSVHMQNKRSLANGTLLYHHITELVAAWQAANGLEATGHADEATCAALETAAQARAAIPPGPTTAPEPELAPPDAPPAAPEPEATSADETLPEPARTHGRRHR